MADKLWNMLKLLPSIAASRKNSMITGLARIDDNTEELILSLYHLPEPATFTNGTDATYFAWFYDDEAKEYKKIGELQRKNGLTFGYRRKVNQSGNGVFITVEPKGREIKEPGTMILASDSEIFYQEFGVREEKKPVVFEAPKVHEPVRKEVEPTYVEIPAVEEEERLEYVAEPAPEPARVAEEEFKPEEQVRKEVQKQPEPITAREEKPEPAKARKEPAHEPVFAAKKPTKPVHPAKHDEHKEPEKVKELIEEFYQDLPADEVWGYIKSRYDVIRNEIDLKEYWEKVKKVIMDFYHDTKLPELFEEIKKDFKYLIDLIGLDDLLDKVECLIKDLFAHLNLKHWMKTIKNWVDELDIHEWYEKGKKYVDAILEEVNPVVLWERIKEWIVNLLEVMKIDEIIEWIQKKIKELRELSLEEIKEELIKLFKQFVDAIKLPQLKSIVIKVTIREKLNQVGNFFQKVKGNVEKSEEHSTTKGTTSEKKMNPYFTKRDPHTNIYSNPMNYEKTAQRKKSTSETEVKLQTGQQPTQQMSNPYAQYSYMQQMPQSQYGADPYAQYMTNPYIFRATPEMDPMAMSMQMNMPTQYPAANYYGYQYSQPQMSCPYMQSQWTQQMWGCPYCQGQMNVGLDALGEPRYLYDNDDDEGYYFITPDGEIITRS